MLEAFADSFPGLYSPRGIALFYGAVVIVYVCQALAFDIKVWHRRGLLRGLTEERAQTRAVFVHRIGGGLALGLSSLLLLVSFGLAPVDIGLGLMGSTRDLDILCGTEALGQMSCDPRAWFWTALAAGLVLPILIMAARRAPIQAQYPEIRQAHVSFGLALLSALAWLVYLAGYEIFFRGLVLMAPLSSIGLVGTLIVCSVLYALAHIPKGPAETVGSFLMGFVFGGIVLVHGTVWPAFVLHSAIALTSEWAAAGFSPERRWFGSK